MPPVTGIGAPDTIQPSFSSGHGDHGANAAVSNGNGGQSASFAEVLPKTEWQVRTVVAPLELSNTASGHIADQAQSVLPYQLKYHVPIQASADGKTVEMDVERPKLAENSVRWEFSRDRVSGHFKMMMELFQNLK